jgi:hypothetical protein
MPDVAVAVAFEARKTGLFSDTLIPFRAQNGGHYDGQQVLKSRLGSGESGARIHLIQPGDPEEILEVRLPETTKQVGYLAGGNWDCRKFWGVRATRVFWRSSLTRGSAWPGF